MPGQDIFISYSREDAPITRRFADAFRQEGLSVWWDDALRSGEAFDEVIEKELRSAKAVVVLWSPRSVASRWVRAEATLADRYRRLAPVIIEPCDRPIIFELTHTVDLSRWDGDRSDSRWQVFLKDIHRLVGAGSDDKAPAVRADRVPVPPARPAIPLAGKQPAFPGSDAMGNLLGSGNVDELITALSSMRDAMKLKDREPTVRPPAPVEPEPEEYERTQFYTSSDQFDLVVDEVHCLELSTGDKLEQRHVVTPLGLTIGRTPPADIILHDSKVSRAHCMIEMRDDQLYVIDMNSTNGTYVDGVRVKGAGPLPVGSVLKVGSYSLQHEKRMRYEI